MSLIIFIATQLCTVHKNPTLSTLFLKSADKWPLRARQHTQSLDEQQRTDLHRHVFPVGGWRDAKLPCSV